MTEVPASLDVVLHGRDDPNQLRISLMRKPYLVGIISTIQSVEILKLANFMFVEANFEGSI